MVAAFAPLLVAAVVATPYYRDLGDALNARTLPGTDQTVLGVDAYRFLSAIRAARGEGTRAQDHGKDKVLQGTIRTWNGQAGYDTWEREVTWRREVWGLLQELREPILERTRPVTYEPWSEPENRVLSMTEYYDRVQSLGCCESGEGGSQPPGVEWRCRPVRPDETADRVLSTLQQLRVKLGEDAFWAGRVPSPIPSYRTGP